MSKKRLWMGRLIGGGVLLVWLWGVFGGQGVWAQEATPMAEGTAVPLRLVGVETAVFPQVTVQLAAADPLQPLSAANDVHTLTLTEADQPIADFTLTDARVGVDVIFVLDANETISQIDGNDSQTRLEKVKRDLIRFATDFMDAGGRDRVSILIPEAAAGQFLVEAATTPSEVVEAVTAYVPDSDTFGRTPLDDMLAQAIAHAADLQQGDGRFQTLLLFTDGAQLGQQVAFDDRVAAAQAISLPLFAAILGARADANEIANVTQLTTPTGGDYVHLPQPGEADSFYQLWVDQHQQWQLTYRSAQTRSGTFALTVTMGEQVVMGSYELQLSPPVVALQPLTTQVTRQGEAVDTPLADLQPDELSLTAVILWADNLPRQVTAVSLLVNGVAQPLPVVAPDDTGAMSLSWALAEVDAGTYELALMVTDELGLTGTSDPVTVAVLVLRPTVAVATAVPEAVVNEAETAVLPTVLARRQAIFPIALGMLVLVIGILVWQRRRQPLPQTADLSQDLADLIVLETLPQEGRPTTGRGATAVPASPVPPVSPGSAAGELVATLERLDVAGEPIVLSGENVTIGRDTAVAQIVLDDPSVSRLHARIRRSGDTCWLYDEGSAGGTYLNFERLGLGPRLLHDQNRIEIGHVRLLFRLRPPTTTT